MFSIQMVIVLLLALQMEIMIAFAEVIKFTVIQALSAKITIHLMVNALH